MATTFRIAKSKSPKTCTDCNGQIPPMTTMKFEPSTGECQHMNPTLCDGYVAPRKQGHCELYSSDQGCPLHGETCPGKFWAERR